MINFGMETINLGNKRTQGRAVQGPIIRTSPYPPNLQLDTKNHLIHVLNGSSKIRRLLSTLEISSVGEWLLAAKIDPS